MALWGKTDNLAGIPKWIARKAYFDASAATIVIAATNRINLIPSNTGFSTGDAVFYSKNGGTVPAGMVDGSTYYIRNVGAGLIELYDTYAHAVDLQNTTGIIDITAVGAGVQSLQRTGIANLYDTTFNNGIIFVDAQEAQVTTNKNKGITGPGWWFYRSYTDAQSKTRYKAECLVAISVSSTISSDAEDVIAADLAITIGTQPISHSVTSPADATFTVAATINSALPLSYQWQSSINSGSTWVGIEGANSTTLVIDSENDLYVTANQFRCVITADELTATSNAATLTIS